MHARFGPSLMAACLATALIVVALSGGTAYADGAVWEDARGDVREASSLEIIAHPPADIEVVGIDRPDRPDPSVVFLRLAEWFPSGTFIVSWHLTTDPASGSASEFEVRYSGGGFEFASIHERRFGSIRTLQCGADVVRDGRRIVVAFDGDCLPDQPLFLRVEVWDFSSASPGGMYDWFPEPTFKELFGVGPLQVDEFRWAGPVAQGGLPPWEEPSPETEPEPDTGDWSFSDIAGSTHAEAIEAIAAAEIASGFDDGTFRPDVEVTRGQMTTFLTRALELAPGGSTFPDAIGTTHEQAIGAVAAASITGGYPDGTFRPNAEVTRGQMATFLTRALELAPTDPTFPDAIGTTHAQAIGAVAAAEIAGGYPDGTFRPNAEVTRGQMATFLTRALGLG